MEPLSDLGAHFVFHMYVYEHNYRFELSLGAVHLIALTRHSAY